MSENLENLSPLLFRNGVHPLLAREAVEEKKKEKKKGETTRSHPLSSFAARSADAIRQSIEIIYNGRSLKGKTLETAQCCVGEWSRIGPGGEGRRGWDGMETDEFVKRDRASSAQTFGKRSYQLQLHRRVAGGGASFRTGRHERCGVVLPCAARVILPLLLFIIGLFTAGSCQKSTIKRSSIPCSRTRSRVRSLYKFHWCYIGCFVSCTCIYYLSWLTPPRESLLENMLSEGVALSAYTSNTSHLIYSR